MSPAAVSLLQRETPFEQVAARLPEWMQQHLPRKWVQLGCVLLLRLPPELEAEAQAVAAAYATLPGVEAVMRRPRIAGELRQPRLPQLLFGSSAETEVREHGLRYRLDLQCVMWAPGNVGWRAGPRGPAAVAALYAHPGPRVVLDCFAGVGYFALQFARHWPATQVIAVEKNPVAAEYLRQNVALNGLDNVEIIEADCRDVEREADIVHLGYIGDTAHFLPHAALQMRAGGDGTIILHDAFRRADYGVQRSGEWDAVPGQLRRELERAAPGLRVARVARVKNYGPATAHLAIRLEAA